MDFTDVAFTALRLVSPVLVAALTWAAAKLASFIRSKVDNEYLRGVLVRLDDAVVTAVKDLWLCRAPHNQRFSPDEAVRGVQPLVHEGKLDSVTRAPATRFPWSASPDTSEWDRLRQPGMNTAFRFSLRDRMTGEQHDRLASVFRELPVTALVFLKHIGRIEVDIRQSGESHSFAWTVYRKHALGDAWQHVSGLDASGDYRVTLVPDDGDRETFLLANDADIEIGSHRGGLDEFTWEGVEYTEVSVAARTNGAEPASIEEAWRHVHVFLPTGEPCPYDLLVSGAFGSNLSRQEIRVEDDAADYNRFLFGEAARVLRDRLIPKLLVGGASEADLLRLLDRRVEPHSRCPTPAAQALYDAVVETLAGLAFLPTETEARLAIRDCAVPPIVADDDVGRAFRSLLGQGASSGGRSMPRADMCGSAAARVLIDHGAYAITPSCTGSPGACGAGAESAQEAASSEGG